MPAALCAWACDVLRKWDICHGIKGDFSLDFRLLLHQVMQPPVNLPTQFLQIINQVFDLEKKVARLTESHSMHRNLDRIRSSFAEIGLEVEDPLGQPYNETRTDCEASIAGDSAENLYITDVIKPVIRLRQGGGSFIVQKAVVIVEGK
jgi:hypothetical protein